MSGISVDYKLNPFSGTSGNERELDVGLTVVGTDDFDSAIAAAKSFIPPRLGPLYLQNIKLSPITPTNWDGSAIYAAPKPTDQPTYSIEIGVGSAHFTQSLQTVGAYAAPGVPATKIPNFKGAIGVTKDGVEGCDVNVPSLTWTEHQLLPSSQITKAYILTIFNLSARMNSSQWRIFAPGEALFMGATLQQSQDRDGWTGDFRWIGSPNAENIPVGNITVTAKLGHDYLWARYQDAVSNGNAVKIPKFVFVERVYTFGDMSTLRLQDPT
ncbi:MAG: hypothetical protein WCH39_07355 [Schlesneria sp.]